MKKNGIVSGVVWSFGERIIAQLVSFTVSVILARILSPDDYGVIAILLIFISLADVFVSNGFGTALIQKKDADDEDFSTIFCCSLAVSILIYIILFVCAPFIAKFYDNESITIFMRILALRIPISSYNTVQKAYISRNMLFNKFFFVTLIGTMVSAVIGIVMANKGFGAGALVSQYLTNAVVDSISLTFIVEWKPKLIFDLEKAKCLMSFGSKVLGAELIGTLFDQIQSLFIGKVFSSKDLAFYNKGAQIPNMISSNVGNSVTTVLFPAIANVNDNYLVVKEMHRKAIRMMGFIVFPTLLGLSLVSDEVIKMLLTDKWLASAGYMKILCFSTAFNLVSNTSLQTIKAVGRSDLLLKIELLKKPVFMIMLVIGAQFGVYGVVWSSAAYSVYAYAVNSSIAGRIIDYIIKEQVSDFIDVFKLSLIMYVIVFFIGTYFTISVIADLIWKFVLCVGSYLVMARIFKSKEINDIGSMIKIKLKNSR